MWPTCLDPELYEKANRPKATRKGTQAQGTRLQDCHSVPERDPVGIGIFPDCSE